MFTGDPGLALKKPVTWSSRFRTPASPAGGAPPAANPQLVPLMKHILQRFQKCILEQYETPQPPNPGVGPLRDNAKCVAGNTCSRASRQAMFDLLEEQANRGDPTNF